MIRAPLRQLSHCKPFSFFSWCVKAIELSHLRSDHIELRRSFHQTAASIDCGELGSTRAVIGESGWLSSIASYGSTTAPRIFKVVMHSFWAHTLLSSVYRYHFTTLYYAALPLPLRQNINVSPYHCMRISASFLKNTVICAYVQVHTFISYVCTLGTIYYLQLRMLQSPIGALN